MQISVSELSQYIFCPRSYFLRYLENLDMDKRGLSLCKSATVRRAIAEIHGKGQPVCDLPKKEIEVICRNIWEDEISHSSVDLLELQEIVVQAKPATKKKSAVKGVSKKEKILADIVDWCFEYSRTEFDTSVAFSNVYFEVAVGDVEFCGFIDQIREHKELGLQLIQFNSSSQSPNGLFVDQDFKMSLCAYAIWRGFMFPDYPDVKETIQFGIIPQTYIYHFPYLERYERNTKSKKKGDPKGNPMIPVLRTEKDLLQFEYELLYTASGIENEFFPKLPNSLCRCSICPYAVSCNTVTALGDKPQPSGIIV